VPRLTPPNYAELPHDYLMIKLSEVSNLGHFRTNPRQVAALTPPQKSTLIKISLPAGKIVLLLGYSHVYSEKHAQNTQ